VGLGELDVVSLEEFSCASQAPIKNSEEFLLEEIKFDETDTTNAGKLRVGCKGVAEGF